MSAQAKARAAQGYTPKPVAQTCANCQHFRSELRLSKWMVERKTDWSGKPFTLEDNGIEGNLRCNLGGFAVRKVATCNSFSMVGPKP